MGTQIVLLKWVEKEKRSTAKQRGNKAKRVNKQIIQLHGLEKRNGLINELYSKQGVRGGDTHMSRVSL